MKYLEHLLESALHVASMLAIYFLFNSMEDKLFASIWYCGISIIGKLNKPKENKQ